MRERTVATGWVVSAGPKRALGAALVVLGALSACAAPQPESQAPAVPEASPSIVGSYTAITINGVSIPGSITNNQGVTLSVLEGSFVIRADGSCSSRTVFEAPSGERITRAVDATYTRDGDTLTMRWEGAGVTTGTIEGDTFTMDNVGMVLVYAKNPGTTA